MQVLLLEAWVGLQTLPGAHIPRGHWFCWSADHTLISQAVSPLGAETFHLGCPRGSPGELLEVPMPRLQRRPVTERLWGWDPGTIIFKAPQAMGSVSRGESHLT